MMIGKQRLEAAFPNVQWDKIIGIMRSTLNN